MSTPDQPQFGAHAAGNSDVNASQGDSGSATSSQGSATSSSTGPSTSSPTFDYGEPVYTSPAERRNAEDFVPENRVGKLNLLALFSLLVAIFGGSIFGIIMGALALNQVKKTGETGRGLAIAGIVVGAIMIVLSIVFVIFIWTVISIGTAAVFSDPQFLEQLEQLEQYGTLDS